MAVVEDWSMAGGLLGEAALPCSVPRAGLPWEMREPGTREGAESRVRPQKAPQCAWRTKPTSASCVTAPRSAHGPFPHPGSPHGHSARPSPPVRLSQPSPLGHGACSPTHTGSQSCAPAAMVPSPPPDAGSHSRAPAATVPPPTPALTAKPRLGHGTGLPWPRAPCCQETDPCVSVVHCPHGCDGQGWPS